MANDSMKEAIEKIAEKWLETGLHHLLVPFIEEHFTLVISAVLVVGAAGLILFWIDRKKRPPHA